MATTYAATAGREMSVGGVLSRGFGAIAAAPVAMPATGFALVALPSGLVGIFTQGLILPGASPFAIDWPVAVGGGLGWWLLYLLAQAVLFRIAVAAIDGVTEPLGAHVLGAARALPALFVLSIVLSLAVGFGMLILFVPGIMLAMMWAVAAPASVIERAGPFAAMGRSRRLTKGARWRVFGVCLIVFVLYYIAAAVIGVGNVAMSGIEAGRIGAQPVGMRILSAILNTGFIAIWSSVQAALYVELRDWKDGPAGARLADIFA